MAKKLSRRLSVAKLPMLAGLIDDDVQAIENLRRAHRSADEFANALAAHLRTKGGPLVPDALQGISRAELKKILGEIDCATDNIVACAFALLDDVNASFFDCPPPNARFCEGANVSAIGAHIAIFQYGRTKKLDREGRDYWIKPLEIAGAVEKVYLTPRDETPRGEAPQWLRGHRKAKSPNNAYRMTSDFRAVLQSPPNARATAFREWVAQAPARRAMNFQAQAAASVSDTVQNKHALLIEACEAFYAPRFLPGYELVYKDYTDGERVPEEFRTKLNEAGFSIDLEGAYPDLLYWNRTLDKLWVIEAVTSDGEVDIPKVEKVMQVARSAGKKGVGFTTAYQTWKRAAERQGNLKNIAPDSYVWIQEDASRQLHVTWCEEPLSHTE